MNKVSKITKVIFILIISIISINQAQATEHALTSLAQGETPVSLSNPHATDKLIAIQGADAGLRHQQLETMLNPYLQLVDDFWFAITDWKNISFKDVWLTLTAAQKQEFIQLKAKEWRFDACKANVGKYALLTNTFYNFSHGEQAMSKDALLGNEIKRSIGETVEEDEHAKLLAINMAWQDQVPGKLGTGGDADIFFNRCLSLPLEPFTTVEEDWVF